MYRKCLIMGAGDMKNAVPQKEPGDLYIAADAGIKNLPDADIVIGDFDSLGKVPDRDSVLVLPEVKDDTDMLAAVREGMKRGYKTFYLFGGTGGRLDHTLANISVLAFIAGEGGSGYLFDERFVITVLKDNTIRFKEGAYGTFSAFAYGGRCCVTEKGFLYEQEDAVWNTEFPIGVSNSFTGSEAYVCVKGQSIVLWNIGAEEFRIKGECKI